MRSSLPTYRLVDVVLPAAFVSVPFALRITLLVEKQVAPTMADLRGFVCDAFVSFVVAFIFASILGTRRRALFAIVPWSVIHHASYEFTKTMNALPPWQSARYLGDGTFLRGSAFAVSNPWLFVAVVIAPAALILLCARRARAEARGETRALRFARVVVPISIFALPLALWPHSREVMTWRQTHFVANNAADLVRGSEANQPPPLTNEQRDNLDRLFHSDLSGADLVAALPKKTNVLLVLLEGISGADLPSVAALHGQPPSAPMPLLDAIGGRHLYFRNFVTHFRGTNRGLYASLCGDYDKLGSATAKMTEIAGRAENVECLPAALSREGYETIFLQAAPLAFMLKDTFMPKIGFSRIGGSEQFGAGYARSNWGVDDRAFFERVRETIRERRDPRPWMMTLLTVGTHHPYPVPDSFESAEPRGSFARAARYSDAAIAEFIAGLEEDGVLRDTVVLITSDESHGVEQGADDLARLLTQHLSFLIAILPTRQERAIAELFAQTDTALSVLDLLGLADERGPFIGRSAFRAYPTPRRVFVANQNARTVGMIGSDQHDVWTCDERLVACDHIRVASGGFANAERTIGSASHEEMALIRAAQVRAALGEDTSVYRDLSLATNRLVPIDGKEGHLLFAGQYVELPNGSAAEIDLGIEVVAASDAEGGQVFIMTDLFAVADGVLGIPEPFTMKVGQAASLRVTFRAPTEAPIHRLEIRAWARPLEGTVAVRFTEAKLRIRAATPSDAPGLTTREHTVAAASAVN